MRIEADRSPRCGLRRPRAVRVASRSSVPYEGSGSSLLRNRLMTSAKMSWWGYELDIDTQMRRVVTRIRAPILSSFVRMYVTGGDNAFSVVPFFSDGFEIGDFQRPSLLGLGPGQQNAGSARHPGRLLHLHAQARLQTVPTTPTSTRPSAIRIIHNPSDYECPSTHGIARSARCAAVLRWRQLR